MATKRFFVVVFFQPADIFLITYVLFTAADVPLGFRFKNYFLKSS